VIDRDGFEIRNGVLSPSHCDDLLRALHSSDVMRSRAGARHLVSFPPIASLVADQTLVEIATTAFGCAATPFRVTLFDKSPDANWSVVWHQDTALPLQSKFDAPDWGPWSVKAGVLYAHAPACALNRVVALRVHLDESTPANGPLRVLPGTHRLGVLPDDEVAELARVTSAVDCLTSRGGVMVMRPLLIHSSPRVVAGGPRRVLQIEYCEDLQVAPGIFLAAA
jgi:ectoine hydroxylase-related dioxygenase (phytanoyl-CoA dioxygenase family)